MTTMEEFDEPIEIELTTKREVAVLMFSLGVGAAHLMQRNAVKGAQTASNLQIRLTKADPDRVPDILDEYGDGGLVTGEGVMSNEAAAARMLEDEEVDPDEMTVGDI